MVPRNLIKCALNHYLIDENNVYQVNIYTIKNILSSRDFMSLIKQTDWFIETRLLEAIRWNFNNIIYNFINEKRIIKHNAMICLIVNAAIKSYNYDIVNYLLVAHHNPNDENIVVHIAISAASFNNNHYYLIKNILSHDLINKKTIVNDGCMICINSIEYDPPIKILSLFFQTNLVDINLLWQYTINWYKNPESIIDLFISYGININMILPGTEETLLIQAVRLGYHKIVKYLLKYNANFNYFNNLAIKYAAIQKKSYCLQYLIEAGAKIRFSNNYCLRKAVRHNLLDNIIILIAAGANVNVNRGFPLMEAIRKKNINMIQHLIAEGATIEATGGRAMLLAQNIRDKMIINLISGRS